MNEYAKMVEQAGTPNEKIFWENLAKFMVSDVKVTLERVGELGTMIHLDVVPYVMFFDFSSEEEMEAYAYATAQATNVLKICELREREKLIEDAYAEKRLSFWRKSNDENKGV